MTEFPLLTSSVIQLERQIKQVIDTKTGQREPAFGIAIHLSAHFRGGCTSILDPPTPAWKKIGLGRAVPHVKAALAARSYF
jgi:hypothetical protein